MAHYASKDTHLIMNNPYKNPSTTSPNSMLLTTLGSPILSTTQLLIVKENSNKVAIQLMY